jgi:hypothetical protein
MAEFALKVSLFPEEIPDFTDFPVFMIIVRFSMIICIKYTLSFLGDKLLLTNRMSVAILLVWI